MAGFLSDFGRDVVAIVGVVGFGLTIIGLLIAYRQLKATATAATAAAEELQKAREQYHRYVQTQIHRILAEVQQHLHSNDWRAAALRTHDLTESILQLCQDDSEWTRFAEDLVKFADQFERIQNEEITYSPSVRRKWRTARGRISMKVAGALGPFADGGEQNEPG